MYFEYLEPGTQQVSAITFGMKFINQSTSFPLSEDIPSEIFAIVIQILVKYFQY